MRSAVYVDAENIKRCGAWGMRYDVLRKYAERDGAQLLRANAYIAGPNDQGIGWNILNSLQRVGLGFGCAARGRGGTPPQPARRTSRQSRPAHRQPPTLRAGIGSAS
jgi:hypothetical protein